MASTRESIDSNEWEVVDDAPDDGVAVTAPSSEDEEEKGKEKVGDEEEEDGVLVDADDARDGDALPPPVVDERAESPIVVNKEGEETAEKTVSKEEPIPAAGSDAAGGTGGNPEVDWKDGACGKDKGKERADLPAAETHTHAEKGKDKRDSDAKEEDLAVGGETTTACDDVAYPHVPQVDLVLPQAAKEDAETAAAASPTATMTGEEQDAIELLVGLLPSLSVADALVALRHADGDANLASLHLLSQGAEAGEAAGGAGGAAAAAAVTVEEDLATQRLIQKMREEEEAERRRRREQEAESLRLAQELQEQENAAIRAKEREDQMVALRLVEEDDRERRASIEEQQRADEATAHSLREQDLENRLYTCEVCQEEHRLEDTYTLDSCYHRFCRECLSGYIAVKVKDGDCAVPCPSCKRTLMREEIRHVCEPADFQRYEDFLLKQTLEAMPDVRWCPRPGCGTAMVGESENPLMRCPNERCGFSTCFNCREEWHADATCDEFQQWKRENSQADERFQRWSNDHAKPCPKCTMPIEKNGGCNHVTCRCKHEFCWLCLEPYKRGHWRNSDCSQYT